MIAPWLQPADLFGSFSQGVNTAAVLQRMKLARQQQDAQAQDAADALQLKYAQIEANKQWRGDAVDAANQRAADALEAKKQNDAIIAAIRQQNANTGSDRGFVYGQTAPTRAAAALQNAGANMFRARTGQQKADDSYELGTGRLTLGNRNAGTRELALGMRYDLGQEAADLGTRKETYIEKRDAADALKRNGDVTNFAVYKSFDDQIKMWTARLLKETNPTEKANLIRQIRTLQAEQQKYVPSADEQPPPPAVIPAADALNSPAAGISTNAAPGVQVSKTPYHSSAEVKADYKAGKITKEEAAKIIAEHFPLP